MKQCGGTQKKCELMYSNVYQFLLVSCSAWLNGSNIFWNLRVARKENWGNLHSRKEGTTSEIIWKGKNTCRISGKLHINGKLEGESRILWVLDLGSTEQWGPNMGVEYENILKTIENMGGKEGEILNLTLLLSFVMMVNWILLLSLHVNGFNQIEI